MRYKSNLVLLELLIALAFFAVSAMIASGVLARAHQIGLDSRRTTEALFIAQDWAERIAASDDPATLIKSAGTVVEDGYAIEQDGYTVHAVVAPEATGAGILYDIRLTVSAKGKALITLPASRYVPGEVSP
jgi:Tfp pilus assembly protein PilV